MPKRSTKQRTQPEPTFAGLAALLADLADEIELGDTARLRPLVEQVRTLAVELGPIEKSRRIRFSTGTVVTVKKRRSGMKVAEVCRADGSRTVQAKGPVLDQLRTDDRTVSDLNEITKLCLGIQTGRPDPQVSVKLRKLAERFREAAGKRQAGKATRKRRRVGIRGSTDKQNQAMDLRKRGFTHKQIADQMGLKYESQVTGFLQRGEAAKQRTEAAVRREQASGRSIRPNVSLDSLEGSQSDD